MAKKNGGGVGMLERRKAARDKGKQVEALKHEQAKRRYIPTA